MLQFIKYWFSISKKIILMVSVFVVVIGIFMYFISKDRPQTQSVDLVKRNREEINKLVNDPTLNQTKEGKISLAVYRTFTCSLIGEACTSNPDDSDKYFKQSMMGFVSNLVSLPYINPPASGVYWAKSGLQNAGFIPKSYAAEGVGFASIRPFMNLWKLFRDLAYMLLVLITIAIGFMIMFRMKLNPQTVISVENALPRIVISIILVTFSFAIAGFLIDLMYILIGLVISILSDQGKNFSAAEYQDVYLTGGPGRIFYGIFPVGIDTLFYAGTAILNMLPAWLGLGIRLISGIGALFLLEKIISVVHPVVKAGDGVTVGILGNILGIGNLPGGIAVSILIGIVLPILMVIVPQLLVLLIFISTLLFLFFRILFLLFRAYLQILILIVFAPFFLLFEAIPGRNAFGFWFKTLFGELMTFPIVITIFVFGSVIIKQLSAGGDLWKPPFLWQIDRNAFPVFLGLGIILITPDIIKLVKEQLLGTKGLPVGIGLGSFLAGGGVIAGGGMGMMQQFSGLAYTAAHIPGAKFLEAIPGFGKMVSSFKGTLDPHKKITEPDEGH